MNVDKLKFKLFTVISKHVEEKGWKGAEMAKKLKISRPVSFLFYKKKGVDISFKKLIEMTEKCGYKVNLDIVKK